MIIRSTWNETIQKLNKNMLTLNSSLNYFFIGIKKHVIVKLIQKIHLSNESNIEQNYFG